MRKKLLFLVSLCAIAGLTSRTTGVQAFCNEVEIFGVDVHCDGDGHTRATNFIRPILRPDIFSDIRDELAAQDRGQAEGRDEIHFDSCRFSTQEEAGMVVEGGADYIRFKYRQALERLDPADPDIFAATDRFGELLHPVQDFYAHSNWVNLLGLTDPNLVDPLDLVDQSTGEWRGLEPLSVVQDDIRVGQIPPTGLPAGWQVEQELTSEIPVFTTDTGQVYRGLVTGWNPDGACPDVRDGGIVDEFSHIQEVIVTGTEDDAFGLDTCSDGIDNGMDGFRDGGDSDCTTEVILRPRTTRLVHGEPSETGPLGHIHSQSDRPCEDGFPTYVCLNKDDNGRPDFEQAIRLAEYQTAHEWCRLLHLTRDSEFGYAASSILMSLWANPEDEPFGPHPVSTPCGTPLGVLLGKPGPIEVTVAAIDINLPPASPLFPRNLIFALYTGDFRRSLYSVATLPGEENVGTAEPVTMCVNNTDTLVATVWGWDDTDIGTASFALDSGDRVLRGVTRTLAGPGFEPGVHQETSDDMVVTFEVGVEEHDTDGDGLSICGEQFYSTDPNNADSDNDGLSDGMEVNTHDTNPLDADSDDDGLTDGLEVNTHGTDPLDTDSDDDGLSDGVEVNVHGTNPLDADSDDDGLSDSMEVNTHGTDPLDADTDDDLLTDGLEVTYGTDPLDADSDDDGLPDGRDVEFVQNAVQQLPISAFKPPGGGTRRAMVAILNDTEMLLLTGDTVEAIQKLRNLRRRLDGCGSRPDANDLIIDCEDQVTIRSLIDTLIAALSR